MVLGLRVSSPMTNSDVEEEEGDDGCSIVRGGGGAVDERLLRRVAEDDGSVSRGVVEPSDAVMMVCD